MPYNIYKNDTKIATEASLTLSLANLEPGSSYKFQVAETLDGTEGPLSPILTVKTNGKVILPTTKKLSSLMYATDCLGIEVNGLGTSQFFGGTAPINIKALSSNVVNKNLEIEVAFNYHLASPTIVTLTDTQLLVLSTNKSLLVTVK